jgi:copper transport protein
MVPAVLLTTSLTSHGAGLRTGAGLGIVVDWLHVMGAAIWIGGLAMLVLLVPVLAQSSSSPEAAPSLLPRVIARFSRAALLALAVLALSGTLQAALELGSWPELLASTYGQLVLVKIGLLLAMLALAALNTRRGRQATADRGRWLARGTRAELAMGVAVLAVAAILTGTPPTRDVTPSVGASAGTPMAAP